MATTVLNSMPCATEDMAKASLEGRIAGYGGGGHKVSVREMITEETPEGWIAIVSIEIEELEEEDEEDGPKESEAKKAEEVIEEQNALFYAMHNTRGSEAERALPEPGEGVDPVEMIEEDEARMREIDDMQRDLRGDDAPTETIGVDSDVDILSETFENDFQVATEPDAEPAAAAVYMSEEELRRRRERAEEPDLVPEPQE